MKRYDLMTIEELKEFVNTPFCCDRCIVKQYYSTCEHEKICTNKDDACRAAIFEVLNEEVKVKPRCQTVKSVGAMQSLIDYHKNFIHGWSLAEWLMMDVVVENEV